MSDRDEWKELRSGGVIQGSLSVGLVSRSKDFGRVLAEALNSWQSDGCKVTCHYLVFLYIVMFPAAY